MDGVAGCVEGDGAAHAGGTASRAKPQVLLCGGVRKAVLVCDELADDAARRVADDLEAHSSCGLLEPRALLTVVLELGDLEVEGDDVLGDCGGHLDPRHAVRSDLVCGDADLDGLLACPVALGRSHLRDGCRAERQVAKAHPALLVSSGNVDLSPRVDEPELGPGKGGPGLRLSTRGGVSLLDPDLCLCRRVGKLDHLAVCRRGELNGSARKLVAPGGDSLPRVVADVRRKVAGGAAVGVCGHGCHELVVITATNLVDRAGKAVGGVAKRELGVVRALVQDHLDLRVSERDHRLQRVSLRRPDDRAACLGATAARLDVRVHLGLHLLDGGLDVRVRLGDLEARPGVVVDLAVWHGQPDHVLRQEPEARRGESVASLVVWAPPVVENPVKRGVARDEAAGVGGSRLRCRTVL